ncbi:MAG TPA: hypothetical protein VMU37_10260 [Caulobacteraceae bacterium]|nr:hypothetical protein [Caulobacteraceae bacterium]
MAMRLSLAVLVLALLAGCGTMHCSEQSENNRVNGGCGLLHKF